MDKKIIFSLLSNVLIAFSATFAIPIFYAVIFAKNFDFAIFFAVIGICVAAVERILKKIGTGHRRRLPLLSAAISMLLTYPLIAAFGFLPFVYFGSLPPLDSLLETMSDLTSAGISKFAVHFKIMAKCLNVVRFADFFGNACNGYAGSQRLFWNDIEFARRTKFQPNFWTNAGNGAKNDKSLYDFDNF